MLALVHLPVSNDDFEHIDSPDCACGPVTVDTNDEAQMADLQDRVNARYAAIEEKKSAVLALALEGAPVPAEDHEAERG